MILVSPVPFPLYASGGPVEKDVSLSADVITLSLRPIDRSAPLHATTTNRASSHLRSKYPLPASAESLHFRTGRPPDIGNDHGAQILTDDGPKSMFCRRDGLRAALSWKVCLGRHDKPQNDGRLTNI